MDTGLALMLIVGAAFVALHFVIWLLSSMYGSAAALMQGSKSRYDMKEL